MNTYFCKNSSLVLAFAMSCCIVETNAASPPADVRNFVSCPIVRDTATVPCWLVEYQGELYYLGIQTDVSAAFHPPLLGHQVIVEGTIADRPRICGGIVSEPVKISPVAEMDANCNTILPADDRYTIDFNPRPPGPSGGRLAFQSDPGPPRPVEVPSGEREFSIYYYFDGKVEGRNAGDLTQVFSYAQRIEAQRVRIVGYRSQILLSDGTVLEERDGLARTRAEEVADLLKTAGLTARQWEVSWRDAPPADGVDDWAYRRVDVTVSP